MAGKSIIYEFDFTAFFDSSPERSLPSQKVPVGQRLAYSHFGTGVTRI
jgi:hypothetical protein